MVMKASLSMNRAKVQIFHVVIQKATYYLTYVRKNHSTMHNGMKYPNVDCPVRNLINATYAKRILNVSLRK